jgi:hypothetical protein
LNDDIQRKDEDLPRFGVIPNQKTGDKIIDSINKENEQLDSVVDKLL